MKKKKQPSAFPSSPSVSGDDSPSFIRIKVPLGSDGKPDLSDWDARDSTKERYRELVNHPEFKKKIGLSGTGGALDSPTDESGSPIRSTDRATAPAVSPLPLFPPEQLKWMFDVYAVAVAFSFSVLLKSDFQTVHEVVKFSEEQKDLMAKPLALVIAKYTPAEWAFYAPEIELSFLLVTITSVKFAEVKKTIAEKKEVKQVSKSVDKPADPLAFRPIKEALDTDFRSAASELR